MGRCGCTELRATLSLKDEPDRALRRKQAQQTLSIPKQQPEQSSQVAHFQHRKIPVVKAHASRKFGESSEAGLVAVTQTRTQAGPVKGLCKLN